MKISNMDTNTEKQRVKRSKRDQISEGDLFFTLAEKDH
jgi:hypothetical protein